MTRKKKKHRTKEIMHNSCFINNIKLLLNQKILAYFVYFVIATQKPLLNSKSKRQKSIADEFYLCTFCYIEHSSFNSRSHLGLVFFFGFGNKTFILSFVENIIHTQWMHRFVVYFHLCEFHAFKAKIYLYLFKSILIQNI